MIRRIAIAAALAATLIAVAPAHQADALASCQTNQICTIDTYSDADFTILVGQKIINGCTGTSSSWGTQRGFVRIYTHFC